MTKTYGFIFIMVLLTQTPSHTQEKAIPLNISLFNENTSIPFTTFVTTPIHPGIQIGTEFNYKTKGKSRFFQTVNVSYFYHKYLTHGLALNSEFGYELRLESGLSLSSLLGLGYLHTWATTKEYVFSNGEYQPKTDWGNARLFPSLSFDLGFYLKNEVKFFVRYQAWAEYPYSPGFIPAMSHTNLHLGAKFNLTKI